MRTAGKGRSAHEGYGSQQRPQCQHAGVVTRRAASGLPHDGVVPEARRQGNPAQRSEPHLLSDQRGRPRGRRHRRGPDPQSRIRLVLPSLPRSGLVPGPGGHAARNAPERRRLQGRPKLGWPSDALALGAQEPQHRVPVEPDRNPVSPGGWLRRGRVSLRAHPRDRGPRAPLSAGRSHLPVARRRHHERRRVLGVAELRLPSPAPGGHRRRRQRLRDLGAGRSANPGRRHLQAGNRVSTTIRPEYRRHRLPDLLRRAPAGGRLRAGAAWARVRAREGHPSLFALAVRRRAALQDAGRAGRGSDARSDRADGRIPEGRRIRQRVRARVAAQGDRARGERGGGTRHRSGEARTRDRRALRLLTRHRSDVE